MAFLRFSLNTVCTGNCVYNRVCTALIVRKRLALFHLGFKDKHGRIWLNSHGPKTPVSRVELNTVEKYLLPNCFHAGEQYTLYSMTRVVSSYM